MWVIWYYTGCHYYQCGSFDYWLLDVGWSRVGILSCRAFTERSRFICMSKGRTRNQLIVSVAWDTFIFYKQPANDLLNKKHLKNVGPIRYCKPPLHCQSPGVASRTPAIAQVACDVQDNDNAWQKGPLWPHGMGPVSAYFMWVFEIVSLIMLLLSW